jgi:hypothetical protein
MLPPLWPALRRRRGLLAFGATVGLVHAGWLAGRSLGGAAAQVGRWLIGAWLVAGLIVMLAGLVLVVVQSAHGLWRRGRRSPEGVVPDRLVDPSRRLVLARGLALPAVAASTGAGGTPAGIGPFVVRREDVVVEGLPRALDGFRIGQITDVHVGEFIDPAHLGRAVAAMNEARVDMAVMTGDLIDDLDQLDETFADPEECHVPHGMVAVLGNPIAAERGACLTLAGHTHGGQVALFGRPLFSAFEHMLGRYRRQRGHLDVSRGTGHWLPFRIGVPPEVTLLTLRAI